MKRRIPDRLPEFLTVLGISCAAVFLIHSALVHTPPPAVQSTPAQSETAPAVIGNSGWQKRDGLLYYFHEDGNAAVGPTLIGEKEYFFDEDGVLCTGIIRTELGLRLYHADGTLAIGWATYDNERYFADDGGYLITGWLQLAGNTYYFHPDGTMARETTEIDGKTYYFTPSGVQTVLVNPWHSVPEGYKVNLISVDEKNRVDAVCYDALAAMLADCEQTGFKPIIVSAYRTQAEQEWLYDRRVKSYEKEGYTEEEAKALAGTSVAVPGTSEHQLGLAVDIVSSDYYVLDDSQATTKTQQWLMAHCWEYGFILRYPTGTSEVTGIIYEPWHYRYVGLQTAMEMRDLGITLEEYLGAAGA